MAGVLYIGADMDVDYLGAFAGGFYLNNAAATYSLKDATGLVIASGSLARDNTLDNSTYPGGNYSATLDGPTVTANLRNVAEYFIEVTLSQGAYHDFHRVPLWAAYRDSS